MRTPVYDISAALGAIALLRHIADHIERSGPAAMLQGGMSLDTETMTVDMQRLDSRAATHAIAESSVYVLNADFTFGLGGLSYAPSCGIREVDCNGKRYRWDGKPPRPPKKGDFYLSSAAPTWVIRAGRDKKKPKHIMTLCT